MTLIVEDGTGRSDAEAYASVAEADDYLTKRGYGTAWGTLTTDEKEAVLRRGADYMVQTYRRRWKGYRFGTNQALDWPRIGVFMRDTYQGATQFYEIAWTIVPQDIKSANIELAYRASAAELRPDLQPQVQHEQVGPISTTYFRGEQRTRYDAVDALLDAYFEQGLGSVRVERC